MGTYLEQRPNMRQSVPLGFINTHDKSHWFFLSDSRADEARFNFPLETAFLVLISKTPKELIPERKLEELIKELEGEIGWNSLNKLNMDEFDRTGLVFIHWDKVENSEVMSLFFKSKSDLKQILPADIAKQLQSVFALRYLQGVIVPQDNILLSQSNRIDPEVVKHIHSRDRDVMSDFIAEDLLTDLNKDGAKMDSFLSDFDKLVIQYTRSRSSIARLTLDSLIIVKARDAGYFSSTPGMDSVFNLDVHTPAELKIQFAWEDNRWKIAGFRTMEIPATEER